MSGSLQDLRDGDLPPGVYERDPVTGQLFPTKKLLTNDPPVFIRPLHVNAKGEIVDVTRQGVDYMKEAAEQHYELMRQIKGTEAPKKSTVDLRNLAERAAEGMMGSGA